MKPADVEFSLAAIRESLKSVLSGTAPQVLDEAIAQVHPWVSVSKKPRDWKRVKEWGYSIGRQRPLVFKDCDVENYKVRVDVSCAFRWPSDPGQEAVEQSVNVRVWALDKAICFRPHLDAARIEQSLGDSGARVVLRYHFDLASQDQQGPRYHIQFGGKSDDEELCWLPEAMNLPRLAHAPTDLVLACEMIAANFFPQQYRTIRTDASWRGAIKDTQRSVLQKYFHACHETVANKNFEQSLLDHLWNKSWHR